MRLFGRVSSWCVYLNRKKWQGLGAIKVVDIHPTSIICSNFFVNDDKNSINDANCDRYVEEATREFRALQRCANGWALPVQAVS